MTTSIGSGEWRRAAAKAALLFDGLDEDLLAQLSDDPIATIETHFELEIDLIESVPDEPSTVAGHYYPETRRIVIERALSQARTRFTALMSWDTTSSKVRTLLPSN